jgi:hypothetical protein
MPESNEKAYADVVALISDGLLEVRGPVLHREM